MCTYDYTPYTGCGNGEQHYYIQWVKCNKAVEKGRYCSLDASTKVEQLRQLSANVLSCPLHGPIAVQQFVLEPANTRPVDDEPERSRARSTTRRAATSRGRTPKRGGPDRDVEQPVRREVRKQRSRHDVALESSDSESSGAFSPRSRPAGRVRRSSDRELIDRRRSRMAHSSHRRSISADVALPPPPPLSMRHGRSDVSLPLKAEAQTERTQPNTESRQSRPKTSLDIPRAVGVIGLPSSPDMHRRASVHRSRSEGVLRPSIEPADPMPPLRNTMSPASDSSPDQNPELPFSTPGRRSRRPVARSIRDRSVDTTMRRIDEHVVSGVIDETHTTIIPSRETPTPETRSTVTTSPEPHHLTTTTTATSPPSLASHHSHRRTNSKPQLNTLQIPKSHPTYPYQRDAYSAPTATPPETDITADRRPSFSSSTTTTTTTRTARARSLRHVDISSTGPSAAGPAPTLEPAPAPPNMNTGMSMNDETASIRSTRSRRYRFDEQVAEGRRWAAAREQHVSVSSVPRGVVGSGSGVTDVLAHMSEPNLAAAIANTGGGSRAVVPPQGVVVGRESVDSGYLSGHQAQRSWEGFKPAEAVGLGLGGVGGGVGRVVNGTGKTGRNTLQKPAPQQQQQVQIQPQTQGQAQTQGQEGQQRPRPAPLDLSLGASSGSGLAPSLMSPGFQSDVEGSSSGKGLKARLLQRMGLKKKTSGLSWDRGGQREVGVEG